MDVKRREKQFQELLKYADPEVYKTLTEEQKRVYQAIFKKKFDLYCNEFDLWLEEEIRKLDRKIEKHLKRKENVQ